MLLALQANWFFQVRTAAATAYLISHHQKICAGCERL